MISVLYANVCPFWYKNIYYYYDINADQKKKPKLPLSIKTDDIKNDLSGDISDKTDEEEEKKEADFKQVEEEADIDEKKEADVKQKVEEENDANHVTNQKDANDSPSEDSSSSDDEETVVIDSTHP